MKICLIALPWSLYRHPSAALGALSAYVRHHEPAIEVTCRSEFLEVAMSLGIPFYDYISQDSYALGEMLYAPFLYPDRKDRVCEFFVAKMESSASTREARERLLDPDVFAQPHDWARVFEDTSSLLQAHLERLVDEVAGRYDVVGLTTCFGQLFANLSFSKRLEERSPDTRIVLGGSTVSERVGPSLLAEYEFLDYVIQGEGEQPLLELVRRLSEGREDMRDVRGVVDRATASESPRGAPLWEVGDVGSLPLPDHDEFAARAEKHNLLWLLTIEGARGCWWDRAKHTGNPRNTCHFCNLNVQWNGYREKSVDRLVSEIVSLNERYANSVLFFLDNIIRVKGIDALAQRLIDTGKDFVIFYEMRANIRPYELLRLWEAGVRYVQFGIEGLSSSYLKRIGKGTSVIANLQAMKTCHELGIINNANLLTDFPGSRPEEVAETCQTILDYAIVFQPLSPNAFWLGRGATIEVLRDEYGVSNIRNADFYRVGLPDDVYERIALLDLSYDSEAPRADWSSVYQACAQWNAAYAAARATEHRHLLTYLDSGTAMRVFDARSGRLQNTILRGVERDLYLYCMEIRRWREIRQRFIDSGRAEEPVIRALLARWSDARILYREGERWDGSRFLALAPALNPEMATRRIRAAHGAQHKAEGAPAAAEPDPATPGTPARRVHLPLV